MSRAHIFLHRVIHSFLRHKKIVAVLLYSALAIGSFLYYHADHEFPPCCDTAVSIMKAKEIVRQGTLNPLQTFNPSFPEHAYGSIFSTEIVGHLMLAGIFQFHPSWANDLGFSNNFFIILFVAALLSAAIAFGVVTKNFLQGVAAYFILFFLYWFGNSYWTGHVAELVGVIGLSVGIIVLQRWYEQASIRRGIWIFILLSLLFFSHVLTFIVYYMLVLVIMSMYFWGRGQRRLMSIAWIAYTVLALIYFRFTTSTQFLPTVDTSNAIIYAFRDILQTIVNTPSIWVAGLIGFGIAIARRHTVVVVFLAVGYVLSQSTYIGAPFYAYRFSVFFVIGVAYIIALGISELLRHSYRPLRYIALVALISYLPFAFHRQQVLKSCYVQNCFGLYPTQMPMSDLEAFTWMKKNLTENAIVAANQKFGYYLPIVSDQRVEFPVGNKREIFTHPSSAERNAIAKYFNIQYIFWDGIFTEQHNSVLEALDFQQSPFTNQKYFKKIYSNEGGAALYEVL